MAIDYSKFEGKVDLAALQKDVAEAPTTTDVPKGTYIVSIEKMEETWNDGRAIRGVLTWLEKLETQTVPEFINYPDFEECVLDIYQEIRNKVELEVEYDANAFDPIKIKEVYDL